MANHPNRRKGYRTKPLLTIAYRYDPAGPWPGPQCGLSSSAWHGAVITQEFATEHERQERIAELRADDRLQWVSEGGDTSASTSRQLDIVSNVWQQHPAGVA